jgi:hypothetical protein
MGVLGGDVWVNQAGRWVSPGDSWYCDRVNYEAPRAFAVRSCEKASAYIRKYPESDQGATAYVLVFADKQNND